MNKKRSVNYFLLLTSLVPIIIESMIQLVGSTASFSTFVGLGVISLVLLGVATISDSGFNNLDNWDFERIIGSQIVMIFSMTMIERMINYPIASAPFLLIILGLLLPIALSILTTHFNIKNILVVLLDIVALFLLGYQGTGFIVILIVFAILIIYLLKTKIFHYWSLQPRIVLSLIFFIGLGVVLVPLTFNSTFVLWISNAIYINTLVAIVLAILVLQIVRINQEIKIDFSTIMKCLWLVFSYFILQQIVNLQIIDLLSPIILMIIVYGIQLNEGLRVKDKSKVSILMPTYNGAATIVETLDSVRMQTYRNYEVIVIDDGSKDNTDEVIQGYQQTFPDFPITYIKQKNADQLNALKNGLQYVSGNIIYILHSDDLFFDQNVMYNGVRALQHANVDGAFIDLMEIDGSGKKLRKVYTKPYYRSRTNDVKLALLFGRNPYVDFAFWQREVFEDVVYQSYLTNNMVAWYDFKNMRPLKMKNTNFFGIRYRIHEGNYLNSADGSVNVLSGELRIMGHLLAHYKVPAFNQQSLIYRAFNKFKLGSLVPVIARNGMTNPTQILKQISARRVPELDHLYVKSILNFHENRKERVVNLAVPNDLKIYHGSDIRLFNRDLSNGDLAEFYHSFMNEMQQGFTRIKVQQNDIEKIKAILEFFTIQDFVEVEV